MALSGFGVFAKPIACSSSNKDVSDESGMQVGVRHPAAPHGERVCIEPIN